MDHFALVRIGPDAKAAVPSLLRDATSTNDALRGFSLLRSARSMPNRNVVVPIFINALQNPYPQTQYEAVIGLGAFGTNARTAVPALVKLIESEEPPPPTNYPGFISRPSVKATALEALQQIDPEAAAKVSTNVDRDGR